jgi:hypothetical protein
MEARTLKQPAELPSRSTAIPDVSDDGERRQAPSFFELQTSATAPLTPATMEVGSTARRRAGLISRWFPRRRPPNRTCGFHRIRLSMSTWGGMPTRAACAGSGVSVPAPPRRWRAERPCSPATSPRPIMPRTHWTPSPCGRLSRPPRWVVTPTTTTGPPPRPGGHSGRCACPEPRGFGGHRRDVSHVYQRPVGRVGAQLYPGGIATQHRDTQRGLARPISKRAGETVPNSYRDRAPQQPIAASFGAGHRYRGFHHWFGLPTPFCLASAPGPLAADRRSIVRAAPTLHRTSGIGLPLSSTRPLRRPGARPLTPPGHMAPRGALLRLWKPSADSPVLRSSNRNTAGPRSCSSSNPGVSRHTYRGRLTSREGGSVRANPW